jgi:hypothetical protein
MAKVTRIVMIEIESENKNEADRLADVIAEQSIVLKHFLIAAIEKFAADEGTAEPPLPRIRVSNTLLGGVGN